MVEIRDNQADNYLQDDPVHFIEVILRHIAQTMPDEIRGIPPHLVWNQIEVSVARARKHGLTSDEDIISFVSVMHEISPNFDEEPTLKAILADTSKTPHERWQALFADTPALNAAWERAAAPTFYDYKAWIGPDDEK